MSEARAEDPRLSLNAAVQRIGVRVGVNPDTLRGWCKQAEIDTGRRPGTTTSEATQINVLEAEVRELKRVDEILLAASSFFSRELDLDCRGDRVNRRSPGTFRSRADLSCADRAQSQDRSEHLRRIEFPPRSARSIRDEVVLARVVRVHESPRIGRRLYGQRKVYKELAREEARGEHSELGHVPCCHVERLICGPTTWSCAVNSSQRELAERMGTTQSVTSRLEEGGGARNRIETLTRVVTALDRHLVVSFPEKAPSRLKDAVQVA